jgi:two-component SAPR family response regulator
MYSCILINRSWLADSFIEKYIHRTGFLNLTWSGAYSQEALEMLQTKNYDVVFVSLPSPDQIIPEGILSELRKQQALIITASYPEYVFSGYELNPVSFLKEPFSMANFQLTIEKIISLEV